MISARHISLFQAAHYILTGLWAVLHLRSFEALTGKKQDRWLVRSTGLMIATVGSYFLMAGVQGPSPRTRWFGMLFPAALATADVCWAWRSTRAKAYLADALVAGIVIGAWFLTKPEKKPPKPLHRLLSILA